MYESGLPIVDRSLEVIVPTQEVRLRGPLCRSNHLHVLQEAKQMVKIVYSLTSNEKDAVSYSLFHVRIMISQYFRGWLCWTDLLCPPGAAREVLLSAVSLELRIGEHLCDRTELVLHELKIDGSR